MHSQKNKTKNTNNTKKTKKKPSMFGINDCHKPKINKKKGYKFNTTIKNKPNKVNPKPFNYKTIILFPHDLGQTKTGTEKAPGYINKFINHKKHTVKTVKNTRDLFKNLDDLYKINKESSGKLINIGGDHSMAIATIADTLNKYPNAKVIYFDAHADINTYKSSNSKHYHGMPLSFVTGIDKTPRFSFIKNKLPFENLLYIGSRCWDIFEVNEVYKDNIKFITPDEINNDFNGSLNKILNFVVDSPIHVSFDVDSIDPKFIPSTGTPVKNGIKLTNAIKILDKLNNKDIVNMDITELNMDLGSKSDGIKSGKNTVLLFKKFLN
jgi:arginase